MRPRWLLIPAGLLLVWTAPNFITFQNEVVATGDAWQQPTAAAPKDIRPSSARTNGRTSGGLEHILRPRNGTTGKTQARDADPAPLVPVQQPKITRATEAVQINPAVAAAALAQNDQASGPARKWVRVTGTRVNVRAAPASSAARITTLPRDTRLELLEERGEWLRIRNPETDETGWMFARFLVEAPATRRAEAPDTPPR